MLPQLSDYTATMRSRLEKARILANQSKNYAVVTKSIAKVVLNTNLRRLSHKLKSYLVQEFSNFFVLQPHFIKKDCMRPDQ